MGSLGIGRGVMIVVALVAMVLAGAGCGEKIAEKAAEKVIEAGSDGAKVDIDTDSGSVSVSGDDGSSSYQFGEDVTIPDDFPDLPLPDDATATGMIVVESDGAPSFTATFTTKMSMKDLYERFVEGLEDGGYTIEQKMQFEGDQGDGFNILASSDDTQVTVFGGAGAGEDGNSLTVGVTPRE
ncbi:MAG: hypothetical protein KKA32_12690 [Actinobacteria bacterium]|nr:hypothetical protein [Actinomycetota bacterium]